MKFSELILFFRKNNKQSQKNVGNDFLSTSTYSKIETERQQAKLSDLPFILENLSISPEEFIIYSDLYKNQKKFVSDFYFCAKNPESEKSKQIILSYFNKLQASNNLTTQQLANLVGIKCSFAKYIPTLKLTHIEISKVYKYLLNRTNYTQYDYSIIRNMSVYFSLEQIDTLLYKIFPLSEESKANEMVLKFIGFFFLNIITISINKNDYLRARKYIEFANLQRNIIPDTNYYYWLNIKYLENVLDFLQLDKFEKSKQINNYIESIEDIGHKEQANAMRNEFKNWRRNKNSEDIYIQ
jgi:hypothetical protein